MTFLIYRQARLSAALADYIARFGAPPQVAVVGLQTSPEVVTAHLPDCEVQHTGGCLAGEVWFAQPDEPQAARWQPEGAGG